MISSIIDDLILECHSVEVVNLVLTFFSWSHFFRYKIGLFSIFENFEDYCDLQIEVLIFFIDTTHSMELKDVRFGIAKS